MSENPTNQPEHFGAHSGSRSDISDYNDGSSLTHYLGNDELGDYQEASFFDGSIALGNDLKKDDEESQDFGKAHSGL